MEAHRATPAAAAEHEGDLLDESEHDEAVDRASEDCMLKIKSALSGEPCQKAAPKEARPGRPSLSLVSAQSLCACTIATSAGIDRRRTVAVAALIRFLHEYFVDSDEGAAVKGGRDGSELLEVDPLRSAGAPCAREATGCGGLGLAPVDSLRGDSTEPSALDADDGSGKLCDEQVERRRARADVREALGLDLLVALAPLACCLGCGGSVRAVQRALASGGDDEDNLRLLMAALELLARSGLQVSFLHLLAHVARLALQLDSARGGGAAGAAAAAGVGVGGGEGVSTADGRGRGGRGGRGATCRPHFVAAALVWL
jgi:hypothetical protein